MVAPTQVFLDAGSQKAKRAMHDCDNYGNDRVCTEAVDLWRQSSFI